MKTIKNIHLGIKNESKFKQAFIGVCGFIDANNWSGACHPSVAILYAICVLLEIDAVPNIGEAGIDGCAFDHSWLTINDKVFDAAIIYPLNPTFATGPIFNSFDLYEQGNSNIKYGVHLRGLDAEAKNISKKNLFDYIMESPDNFLFELLANLCDAIGVYCTESLLKNKLSNVYWNICK